MTTRLPKLMTRDVVKRSTVWDDDHVLVRTRPTPAADGLPWQCPTTTSASQGPTQRMMYVECSVGRFIETRWIPPIESAHVDHFVKRTTQILSSAPEKFVVFADLEQASVMPPEWIDRVVEMLCADNGRIERNGILIKGTATFILQMERMIRQANNPSRRTFRDFGELKAWLLPAMTPAERARFEAFRETPSDLLKSAGGR